ncbi:MAG TPA: hypothetical protein VJQ54_21410, partial [Candidatus Sulfotelmatobacter sp.]|nr:hypothetical protein [Candidatus Sulfotelmatobacter sp.]
RLNLPDAAVRDLLDSAKQKMYTARLRRPTPYVDKTVYVGWNSLCISAYLEAAKVLHLPEARRFALRSLDRALSQAYRPEQSSPASEKHAPATLMHVVAYSDPDAQHRDIPGMLDDYAFTAQACLDAYEATADRSYFKFARAIVDAMVSRFFDETSGGFFDSEPEKDGNSLGALGTMRKPLQDSPTPAGNPIAAIALIRMHHYTGDASYRDKAEKTLAAFAGVAGQFGIFAASYGIALLHFLASPLQVVVVDDGNASDADELYKTAVSSLAFNKTVLRMKANQAVRENLAPALAETIPNLPQLRQGKSFAVLCSGTSCQPPVFSTEELQEQIRRALSSEQ